MTDPALRQRFEIEVTMKNMSRVGQLKIVLLTGIFVLPFIGQNALAADKAAGKATIYADSFNGKKTANGDIYKSHKVSAASNKLPLGSKVMVKNKQTGKKAVVEINDRMSKNSSAVVDLSKGAAQKLGVKGTAQVDAKVVKGGK